MVDQSVYTQRSQQQRKKGVRRSLDLNRGTLHWWAIKIWMQMILTCMTWFRRVWIMFLQNWANVIKHSWCNEHKCHKNTSISCTWSRFWSLSAFFYTSGRCWHLLVLSTQSCYPRFILPCLTCMLFTMSEQTTCTGKGWQNWIGKATWASWLTLEWSSEFLVDVNNLQIFWSLCSSDSVYIYIYTYEMQFRY